MADAPIRRYVVRAPGVLLEPKVFYATGNPVDQAAVAMARWTAGTNMTLWPTHEADTYRATWFDPEADVQREVSITIKRK